MKRNNLITVVIVAITLFLTSCGGSKFTEEEMTNLLFNYDKGILAGVDIGDNWEDIKVNHNPEFTVRDEKISTVGMFYQLRKENNDDNKIIIDFELDGDKNITVIKYDITLSIDGIEDVNFMNKLKNTIVDFFANKLFYALIDDSGDSKTFQFKKNDKIYDVSLFSYENEDVHNGHISIEITPKN